MSDTFHVVKLIEKLNEPANLVPEAARQILKILIDTLATLDAQIAVLDVEIARRAKTEDIPRRLMTIPG